MLNKLLNLCKKEWELSLTDRKHPYRYFVLGTLDESMPALRTVVLRDFNSESIEFTVFTDARSPKVSELNKNKVVELLFYNSDKLTQVRVQAKCILQVQDDSLFNEQGVASQKDYTTAMPPGTPIDSISSVSFLKEQNHFLKLVFQAIKIDYLELKRPVHIRAVFEQIKQKLIGEFRTP